MTAVATQFSEVILTSLLDEFGALRGKTKLLARAAKASPKAAEKWLAGDAIPSAENLGNLLRSSKAMREAVMQWAESSES